MRTSEPNDENLGRSSRECPNSYSSLLDSPICGAFAAGKIVCTQNDVKNTFRTKLSLIRLSVSLP